MTIASHTPFRLKEFNVRLALAGLTVLSLCLHLWRITREAFANPYYAVAVRSMLAGGSHFFFVSFDPLGFVAVDKPPLGLWLQTLSAWIFGFHGWALILPQAAAGALCVPLLYAIVHRGLPAGAALLAGFFLMFTPILVAASRSNVFDSLLLLVLLAAAYACLRAAEAGSLRWLTLCMALVGIGFNIKMLEAYLVLPSFFLLYLFCAPVSWKKKLAQLAAASLLLIVLSLAWTTAVDLTPASQRPYVGGTQSNRVMELVIGHNGLARLGLALAPEQATSSFRAAGITMEIGQPGGMRLFQQTLGGQVSWLLPLACFGLAAWFFARRNNAGRNILLWAGWLLPAMVFFSMAGYFHRYYLVLLAPPVAALSAVGIYHLRAAALRRALCGWLLPVALAATATLQVKILMQQPSWNDWIAAVTLFIADLAAGLLLLLLALRRITPRRLDTLLAAGIGALLIAPVCWCATPILGKNDPWLPFAGPELLTPQTETSSEPLINFLEAHRSGEAWLLATFDGRNAAPLMLASGQPVMAIGGFDGSDPILSPEDLMQRWTAGELRFILYPDQMDGLDGGRPLFPPPCVPVPPEDWGGQVAYPMGFAWTLWDCRIPPG
jgi:4-amino-4-deoxy-L-arabinose transferase-like glycosyltransferase